MKVKLHYYRPGGKWYTSEEYETSAEFPFQVMREAERMRMKGELPGLVTGDYEGWHVLVVFPDEYPPALVLSDKARKGA